MWLPCRDRRVPRFERSLRAKLVVQQELFVGQCTARDEHSSLLTRLSFGGRTEVDHGEVRMQLRMLTWPQVKGMHVDIRLRAARRMVDCVSKGSIISMSRCMHGGVRPWSVELYSPLFPTVSAVPSNGGAAPAATSRCLAASKSCRLGPSGRPSMRMPSRRMST